MSRTLRGGNRARPASSMKARHVNGLVKDNSRKELLKKAERYGARVSEGATKEELAGAIYEAEPLAR